MGIFTRDPMPVECPSCHAQSDQRRPDLYALRARCPACGGSLEEIGQNLRASADSLYTGTLGLQILIAIGEKFGIDLEDSQIMGHFGGLPEITLREIGAFFQRSWPSLFQSADEARGVVLEAARSVVEENKSRRPDLELEVPELDDSALDKPLLESLDPNRWTRLEKKE